jgi:hypothetical protein
MSPECKLFVTLLLIFDHKLDTVLKNIKVNICLELSKI